MINYNIIESPNQIIMIIWMHQMVYGNAEAGKSYERDNKLSQTIITS